MDSTEMILNNLVIIGLTLLSTSSFFLSLIFIIKKEKFNALLHESFTLIATVLLVFTAIGITDCPTDGKVILFIFSPFYFYYTIFTFFRFLEKT